MKPQISPSGFVPFYTKALPAYYHLGLLEIRQSSELSLLVPRCPNGEIIKLTHPKK